MIAADLGILARYPCLFLSLRSDIEIDSIDLLIEKAEAKDFGYHEDVSSQLD